MREWRRLMRLSLEILQLFVLRFQWALILKKWNQHPTLKDATVERPNALKNIASALMQELHVWILANAPAGKSYLAKIQKFLQRKEGYLDRLISISNLWWRFWLKKEIVMRKSRVKRVVQYVMNILPKMQRVLIMKSSKMPCTRV